MLAHWADNGTKEAINLPPVMAGYGCFLFFFFSSNGREKKKGKVMLIGVCVSV